MMSRPAPLHKEAKRPQAERASLLDYTCTRSHGKAEISQGLLYVNRVNISHMGVRKLDLHGQRVWLHL